MNQTNESFLQFVMSTRFLTRCSPMALIIYSIFTRIRRVIIVGSVQYIGISPAIGSIQIPFSVWLEECEINNGDLAEIEVFGLSQFRAIVPLPRCIISNDFFIDRSIGTGFLRR